MSGIHVIKEAAETVGVPKLAYFWSVRITTLGSLQDLLAVWGKCYHLPPFPHSLNLALCFSLTCFATFLLLHSRALHWHICAPADGCASSAVRGRYRPKNLVFAGGGCSWCLLILLFLSSRGKMKSSMVKNSDYSFLLWLHVCFVHYFSEGETSILYASTTLYAHTSLLACLFHANLYNVISINWLVDWVAWFPVAFVRAEIKSLAPNQPELGVLNTLVLLQDRCTWMCVYHTDGKILWLFLLYLDQSWSLGKMWWSDMVCNWTILRPA